MMMSEKLCVVMPVYNEQAAIGGVLTKWDQALKELGIDFTIRPYNDGSKDNSLQVMRDFVAAHPDSRIEVRDKPNGGHGNTILTGYREAVRDGFDWVFQIDSDDEMGPEKFGELWKKRGDCDFLVGIRDGRVQALPRKVISFVSRLCVRLFYGKSVWDVNTPYRLMRASAFQEFYNWIPLTTFAPNVILSGLAARHRLRCFETRVPQHDRTTGEVSIKKWKLLKAAAKSFWQTIMYSFASARLKDWGRLLFWGVAWGFAAVSIVVGVKNGWREFDFQWDPAKLLMMGDNPYLYSLEHKAIPYDGFMEAHIDANQVPSCLLLLAPFTFLPQLLANQVWDICNLLFSVVFLVYFYKTFFEGQRCARLFPWIAMLLFAGTPWRVLIGNGQHLMFSFAFFFAAYYYSEKGRPRLAGVLLALSAFKYTTIAPMALIFVACRKWKPVLIAALLHLVATLGCGWWLGTSPLELVLQSFQVSATLTAEGMADIASLVSALNWGNPKIWANIGYLAFGLTSVLLIGLKKGSPLLKLAIFSIIANVMFYHRIYDFITILVPLAYVMTDEAGRGYCNRAVRYLTIANIVWIFFLSRLLRLPSLSEVAIYAVLQHGLLLTLISAMFSEQDNANLMRNSSGATRILVK